MEATIAAAPTAPAARHPLPGTGIPAMRGIMGENFTPFSLVKARDHFGVDMRQEPTNFIRVPWSESVLRDCASNSVLGFVPRGVSMREMMINFPALFDSTDLPKDLLDYAPKSSRYCLMSTWVRRPHTGVRKDETPSDFHTVAYLMTMGLLAGRKLITNVTISLYDHKLKHKVSVCYEGSRISIGPPMVAANFGLYERAPCLG